jgi:hypothetical protein
MALMTEIADYAAQQQMQAAHGFYEQQWRQAQIMNTSAISPTYTFWNGPGTYDPIPPPQFFAGLDMATAVREALLPLRPAAVEEPPREMLKRISVEVPEVDLGDARQKLAVEAEVLLGYTPLRQELRAPGALRRALAKLEIAILEEESVNQYKKQMVEHYQTTGKMPMPTWRLTPLKNYAQPVPEFVLAKAVSIKRELPEAEFIIEQLAVDPFLIVSLVPLQDFTSGAFTLQRMLDPERAAYVEAWAEPKFEASL